MSSCGIDVSSEQLCYIPCSFCQIVLAVSVPCSSLFDIVTVRCGHCANLWSVNMAAAAFHSLSTTAWQIQQQQQQSQLQQQQQAPNFGLTPITNQRMENQNTTMGSSSSRYHYNRKTGMRPAATAAATNPTQERVVNRPPEKRQRVPSAYNQFIKEEIQRIKANNPDISHREAFSTAAKNWAHFPHIHFGLMLENNQAKLNEARTALLNN